MPIPNSKKPVRNSAKNIVYQTVCDWIITGILRPGEKIIDSELAEYFNVSRTPVREALQMLQNHKLIHVRPGRATEVTEINVNDIGKCYRPLAEIQGLAAELACESITGKELEKLESAQLLFSKACEEDDTESAIEQDGIFHEIIVDAADNEYIADFSHMMTIHIQRIKYHYFHTDLMRKTSVAQHKDILDAIKVRNSSLAHTLMREHWLYVMNRVLNDTLNNIHYVANEVDGTLAE